MRLAGIDIGSNAVRLLIADIFADSENRISKFRKVKLYRVPVRLGQDAFGRGMISKLTLSKLVKTMRIFVDLMDIYEVEDYVACATSAMREAKNASEVIKKIAQKTKINIEVIDGDSEANLILSNNLQLGEILDPRFAHLYVDVGGGSTEISLINQDKVVIARSFPIGTVRLFNGMVSAKHWTEMEDWVAQFITSQKPLAIIGSGGNINRIFKRSGNKSYEPLMYATLLAEKKLLSALDVEDRIYLENMNRDRAEVIVPALDIFLFVMEKAGIRQVFVPKIGVADGLVRKLFLKKIG